MEGPAPRTGRKKDARFQAMHREMHRSTSRRVDTTGSHRFRTGAYLVDNGIQTRRARTFYTCSRHVCGEKKRKKTHDPVHHMRAPGEMHRHPRAMKFVKLSDRRILRR